jgi:hypothetical protein
VYSLRGMGATALANAIFRQEGVLDPSGNWIPTSLGYRLNNPGNLNYAGQPGATPTTQGNGSEAQFDTLADGVAATDRQLALDASRGLTLAQRLNTWATGNKAAYVSNVSGWLGVDPNTPLSDLMGSGAPYPPAPVDSSPAYDSSAVYDPSAGSSAAGLSTGAVVALGLAAIGLAWAVAS